MYIKKIIKNAIKVKKFDLEYGKYYKNQKIKELEKLVNEEADYKEKFEVLKNKKKSKETYEKKKELKNKINQKNIEITKIQRYIEGIDRIMEKETENLKELKDKLNFLKKWKFKK